MSKQLHNNYRRVLRIERLEKTEGSVTFPVTIVTWAIVERENSKSIFTRHLGVTVYAGKNPKDSGVVAYMTTKPYRLPKSLEGSEEYEELRSRISRAYTHALYAYLGDSEKEREGKVRWYAKGEGVGTLEDKETGLTLRFYACNFIGADSLYEYKVTNVNVDTGSTLRFKLDKDPFVSVQLGATYLRMAS